MGITAGLITGIGHLCEAEDALTWVDSGVVPVASDPPPGFYGTYPDAPDVCAALACYTLDGGEPTLSASVKMLQVRTRSSLTDISACDTLDDAIAQVLLGHYPVDLDTGVTVSVITAASSTPLGRDAQGRMERVTNYRVVVHDPGPHRG